MGLFTNKKPLGNNASAEQASIEALNQFVATKKLPQSGIQGWRWSLYHCFSTANSRVDYAIDHIRQMAPEIVNWDRADGPKSSNYHSN